LLATRHLVGTKEGQIRTEIVACTHLGLFLGATTLLHTWSKIARWLAVSGCVAPVAIAGDNVSRSNSGR
jgi:hypothetical protein